MRVLLLGLFACGSYEHGSLGPSAHALPCLDVALEASHVPAVAGTVVAWRFGNRCDHSVVVDLGRARVTAISAEGDRATATAFDPDHEIVPLRLDSRGEGHEQIAYVSDPSVYGDALVPAWLDVELAGVDGSAPEVAQRIRLDVPAPPVAIDAEVSP